MGNRPESIKLAKLPQYIFILIANNDARWDLRIDQTVQLLLFGGVRVQTTHQQKQILCGVVRTHRN
jgi:hypothetical protein